jgi:succinate dehydrogenase / fumarate reductase, membrane anchor subunit
MMARFRNTGSARSGFGEWLLQRLSALYLGGFTLWLVLWLGLMPPADHAAWKAWLAGGAVRLAFALFFLSALVHAWVGMRSVFLDYLKPAWLRFLAQLLTGVGLLACAFWAAQILLMVPRS